MVILRDHELRLHQIHSHRGLLSTIGLITPEEANSRIGILLEEGILVHLDFLTCRGNDHPMHRVNQDRIQHLMKSGRLKVCGADDYGDVGRLVCRLVRDRDGLVLHVGDDVGHRTSVSKGEGSTKGHQPEMAARGEVGLHGLREHRFREVYDLVDGKKLKKVAWTTRDVLGDMLSGCVLSWLPVGDRVLVGTRGDI